MAPPNNKGAWKIEPRGMPRRKTMILANEQHSLWRTVLWHTMPNCRQSQGQQTVRKVAPLFLSFSFCVLIKKEKKEAESWSEKLKQWETETVEEREQTEKACEAEASQLTAETANSCKKATPALNGFNLWTQSPDLNTRSWNIVETFFSLGKESLRTRFSCDLLEFPRRRIVIYS